MKRINQHTPLESAATARLLSAAAVSLVLHSAIVCLASGPVYSRAANVLQVSIDLPFARRSPDSSLSKAMTESNVPVPENVRNGQIGFQLSDLIDSNYYPTSELDVFPAPRFPIPFVGKFSASAQIRVLTKIDASGRVTETRIFDSDAFGSENDAAMNAIMGTPFQAAQRNGHRVRSEIVIELASR